MLVRQAINLQNIQLLAAFSQPVAGFQDQNCRPNLLRAMSGASSLPRLSINPHLWKLGIMGIIRTSAFSVSIDGFAAGLHQTIDNPFGERGMALPDWMLKTRMFHKMTGRDGGSTGIDDGFAERSMANIGAWIMG
jgi:hypothetical protein